MCSTYGFQIIFIQGTGEDICVIQFLQKKLRWTKKMKYILSGKVSQNNSASQLPRHYKSSHAYSKVLVDKQNNYLQQEQLLPLLLSCQIFHGLKLLHKWSTDDWEIPIFPSKAYKNTTHKITMCLFKTTFSKVI